MTGLQTFGMIAFIICFLVAFISLGVGIYFAVTLTRDKRVERPIQLTIKKCAVTSLISAFTFMLAMFFIFIWNRLPAEWYHYFKAFIGGFFFFLTLNVGTNSFIIHYYTKDMPKKEDKCLFISLMISVALIFLCFLFTTDAFADFGGEHFLLPNAISFTKGFVRPDEGGGNIAFYAICILLGAVFVFLYCDHKMYMKYGKHGLIDSLFLIAFPAGIIGARIFYVVGNWHEFANREFWHVFAIWEGGLTILGGAVVGIAVGVLWLYHKNKGTDRKLSFAIDLIIPTILIAQAVGRWGNFFNCEVHGGLVPEEYWTWLPRIVFNNSHYSSAAGLGWAPEGQLYAPLFLIEGMVNMLGFFVMAHLFGVKLKRFTEPTDMVGGYLIWYGFTRVFMEPLRHPSFNMGTNGYWSWFWSVIFVVAGILWITVNHIVRSYLKAKKEGCSTVIKYDYIGGSIAAVISITFIIVGSLLMVNNPSTLTISLNGFNSGIIFLSVGCSLLLASLIPFSKIYLSNKFPPKEAK